ncbi:DUF1993 family protein [Maricaulis sp. D1M11]|uniref:DUF1993 family protein n=1 Tax=Maricaulis sp. D1M11 TaxID=3076117 RepID=UPI0039B43612
MSLSQYLKTQISQAYDSLDIQLDKLAAHIQANGLDEAVALQWRLAPDMMNFTQQIQRVSDFSVMGHARLSGQDAPTFPDEETTLDALRSRLAQARAFIDAVPAEALDADPEGLVSFPAGAFGEMSWPRAVYAQRFLIANVLFHTSMAYAILRSIGVPLGKPDALGFRSAPSSP